MIAVGSQKTRLPSFAAYLLCENKREFPASAAADKFVNEICLQFGEIQQGSDFIPLPQSILAAGRFSVPGCLVRSSPSVFRYCSANAFSAATTAGFWGAKSNVSPGSVDRS